MLCIYCRERQADAREHPLPQSLGGFLNYEPLRDRICQPCNKEIGKVEQEFARLSPEAVLRSTNWVKRGGGKRRGHPSAFEPQRIGGKHLRFHARDCESGYVLLWQPDTMPGTVKPLSQFVILDEGGRQIGLVPIPAGIHTGRELAELFKEHQIKFPIASVYLKAATGDEERIKAMLAEWGRTVELTKGKPGPVPGPQVFKGEVTTAYFRALAKIGFHYALTHIRTIAGSEPEFRALREFVRHGNGEPHQFLHQLDKTPTTNGPPGHVLTALATPESVIVSMQFFIGCEVSLPQWSLVIPNPTVLVITQKAAHYYPYEVAEDGSLRGGEVVELTMA